MVPAVVLAVVAFIAGKPGAVVCDADTNRPIGAPAGYTVEAWTTDGTGVSHLSAKLCAGLEAKPDTLAFAASIGTLIHESAHQRGVHAEDCAELWADLVVYDVLRRFYGIPFFSRASWWIGGQVLAETRLLPSNYQPTALSCA